MTSVFTKEELCEHEDDGFYYLDGDGKNYTLAVRFYEVEQVGDKMSPICVREERFSGMPYGLCRMADVESFTNKTDGGAFGVLFWKNGDSICLTDGQDFVTTDCDVIAKYINP